ncbi:cell division protein FtsA [Lactobacillus kefiranofaciens subsp. kefirgranum]|uniref:cell division protein FtsA n=1 Tax=Lactobacillus kefiranofaciens TaxID=267818 RepID=UPI000705380F|nr:cell division protein FtsA [Lactobacillus kefiranofaciens]MCJ2171933.1 cell division protein FtsA [Lactobacillus kefiranofaciens]MCP9330969.1 cell division protein FtsA [Lactobacillus kefiranofaciens]MDF4142242.1 cell division protein FtsA [Lactobacillus kefiranofaciens]PAK98606.1 cell division protein FtsA [Lactobacillus kefiranofaciens]QNT43504.1 cell division protein FtsA [Lactobacillus kefiranofaciens]
MENSNLLVGLDIGTTSVKAVVADSGKVIGAVTTPNSGMRHGQIVDIDQTAAAISRALKGVAEKTNAKIYSVVAGIPVGMLQLETATGFASVGEQGTEVNNDDVKRAISSVIHSAVKDDRDAITFLPSRFLIDSKTEVDDPRKMIAHSLGVTGILLTAPTGPLHNIKKAIERAGYHNNFFVPTPLAISSVALNESEKTFGSVIVDLGGGVSTATVIKDGQIKYANIDLEGGSDITHDISAVLSISKNDAEQVKLDYGFADPSFASKNDKFAINSVGGNGQQMVDEVYLSEIINARLEQILTRLGKGLAKHHALKQPGGIVITGGTSLLQGIDTLTANGLNVKARIYQPDQIGMRNPIYTAAYGIINYAYKMSEVDYLVNGVIYGFGENIVEQEASKPETSKVSKSIASNSETEAKEAYNRTKMSADNSSTDEKNNNKEKTNGLKDFFKKFFD